ncbi:MAG: hypothetical protein PVI01_07665, partial [Gemmatimonadales bacterium]
PFIGEPPKRTGTAIATEKPGGKRARTEVLSALAQPATGTLKLPLSTSELAALRYETASAWGAGRRGESLIWKTKMTVKRPNTRLSRIRYPGDLPERKAVSSRGTISMSIT